MPFEDLPTVPDAEDLIDQAFSRASRTGRSKGGLEAQRSMLEVASHVLSDNLEHVGRTWPTLDELHPFHRELLDAMADVEDVRDHLGSVGWAAGQVEAIGDEHRGRLRGEVEVARRHRKQAFARMADVVREVDGDLRSLESVRQDLATLPSIDPTVPTIVLAGYPNVGKSSLLNAVTRASAETATYPFTTTRVDLGHLEHRHITYQVLDTPGLLDRPAEERNDVERQAIAALEHVADCVVVVLDASETCGYPLADQLALRDELADRFEAEDIPVITVANKADRSTDVEADAYMSVTEDEGVAAVIQRAIDAIEYRPSLPFEGSEG